MKTRLLNIRLDPEDQLRAKELRARGISLSDLVRRALREEVGRVHAEPHDSDALLDDIFARHPMPKSAERPRIDATDRKAVREHIQRRLRARR